MGKGFWIIALLCGTVAASANAPDRSPVPKPRAGPAAVEMVPALVEPIARSPKPERRPKGLFAKLRSQKTKRVSRKGSVCGVPAIKGTVAQPIAGRIRGCGLSDGVRVTSVSGVVLSTPAIIDCTTAKALNTWVKDTVQPTVKRRGGGVSSLKVAAHYACRTRNNRPGAKVSEHGRGRAIDISALRLKDGSELRVLGGWRNSSTGPILKKLHRGACGPFGTVLGPNADRYHQDHFHFDTARYRSGPYCR